MHTRPLAVASLLVGAATISLIACSSKHPPAAEPAQGTDYSNEAGATDDCTRADGGIMTADGQTVTCTCTARVGIGCLEWPCGVSVCSSLGQSYSCPSDNMPEPISSSECTAQGADAGGADATASDAQ